MLKSLLASCILNRGMPLYLKKKGGDGYVGRAFSMGRGVTLRSWTPSGLG